MKILRTGIAAYLLISLYPAIALAASDLALPPENITFSSQTLLEGRTVRIYASVVNTGETDLRGVVRFFAKGNQISADQPVSVVKGKDDTVFVDWIPEAGTYILTITVVPFNPANDPSGNNTVTREVTVLADADRDGIPNTQDPDDDNDGVPDEQDAFPLNSKESIDSDGDRIGNNADEDDDNDGTKDADDALPLNALETKDTDKDGIGDNEDTDDDGDGISDIDELKQKLDPLKSDTDGDGVKDGADAFPSNAAESGDYDKDGIGDNADTDADNDGVVKQKDINDTNLPPVIVLTSKGKNRRRLARPNEPLQFETTDSYDPDGGSIHEIIWSLEGKKINGKELLTSITEPGFHTLAVTLTDDKGESNQESFRLFIAPSFLIWGGITALFLFLILALFFVFSYSRRR